MTPRPGTRYLLDTSVVVEYREAREPAIRLFTAVRERALPEFSQLTALVLLARCPDRRELDNTLFFLEISAVHPVNARVMHRAQQILGRHPPPCPLTADDAVVAATALGQKIPLYTLDPGRFAGVPGLTAVRPY